MFGIEATYSRGHWVDIKLHDTNMSKSLCSYSGIDVDVNTKYRERHYNAVEYNMMLHALLQWSMRNINQSLNTLKAPHISP